MFRLLLASAAMIAAASPALAQTSGSELPDPNDRSNSFTIAAGIGATPDYEGSDEHRLIPAIAIRGSVGGMGFWSSGTALYLDVIPRPSSGIDFDFGPIVGVRLNRSGDVKDGRVDKLPELDPAIEIGAFGGLSWHGLTNPYDTLGLRVDVVKDVGGAHKSTLVTPSISFATPLSRTTYFSTSVSAEWAGDKYANYYYSISPAEGLVAGLPAYDADGGLKNWGVSLMGLKSLSGDLRHGFGLFGLASYKRLVGDFKDSPIVDDRGSASQWMGALGVSYSW